ncbi:MAG: ATP-dependent RecD-like DNA helicase [Lachnospiraceae bacterium]|nr:ATP-dependent RecD-like DNA helicase [Lachnospiraceae bacterium]
MEKIQGFIENIIYQNPENQYAVFELTTESALIVSVGVLPGISEGMSVELTGEFTNHPTYGRQFKTSSFEIKRPEDVKSIERYLGSGAIKGVGPKMAKKIVEKFGEDSLRVIDEEPELLVSIKGISERIAQSIAGQVKEKSGMRDAMLFLQKYNLSLALAVKIYEYYGESVYTVLRENPYRLSEDIDGVGFKTADEIALAAGMPLDSKFRMHSGVLYALTQAAVSGSTCLPQNILIEEAARLLGVGNFLTEQALTELLIDHFVIKKEIDGVEYIFDRAFYAMENNITFRLLSLKDAVDVSPKNLRLSVDSIESEIGLKLAPLQREAVESVAKEGVLVITGGPGTGKTTIINAIIHYMDKEGMDFVLTAPTGRAAKRMSEATGYEASTIHRLLEVGGGTENGTFSRNEDNPLEIDAVIVDEMSMVDVPLMNALLKAIPKGARLILVGDENQLPSVGPGSVLSDVIKSGCFKVVELNEVFRQAGGSDIVLNAHGINEGKHINIDNNSKDFFFLKRYDVDKIINVTLQLVLEKLPGYVDAKPTDIQVLSPMKKGPLGVINLNEVLRHYLNPPAAHKSEHERGDITFRDGDKVMQIKNDYELEWEVRNKRGYATQSGKGVFNGDIGFIRTIDSFTKSVLVEFDEGRLAEYPFEKMDELELAYAVTIHKSQGSEYPAVVIPILNGPDALYNRNLIYTAVTRARKCVSIVGDENTFYSMIDNNKRSDRYSGLTYFLKNAKINLEKRSIDKF